MLMPIDIEKNNLEIYLGQADIAAPVPETVPDWVMVVVRPGMEQEARDGLRRRGVGAWWPNFSREIGAKDRQTGRRYKRSILASVLPGIIFSPARLTGQFWSAIDHAPGVINIARRFNTDFILLCALDVVLIHKIEAGLNHALPSRASAHSYVSGEKVRFIDDEYRKLPGGVVLRCSRDGHVTVEVDLFGRMTAVDVLPQQIEPIDSRQTNRQRSSSTDARDRPAKSPCRR